jgi:hypothetical protein
MTKEQLDLELDATGIQDQIANLAEKAIEMGCKWLQTVNSPEGLPITDDTVADLLKQARAVQGLLDTINKRQH